MAGPARVIFALVTMMLVAACANNPRVQSDFDSGLDFSQYQTYSFANPEVLEDPSFQEYLGQTFSSALEPQLLIRGLSNSSDPDVLINISVETKDISRAPTHNICPSYGDYYGRYLSKNFGTGGGDPTFCTYTEGLIKIEMVDTEARRTIWEGVSHVRIDKREQKKGFNLIRYIIADVGIMFADFPGKAHQQTGDTEAAPSPTPLS